MLRLSKFEPQDRPLYERLAYDPEVMEMNLGRVFTPEEAQMVFEMILALNEQSGVGYYKVYSGDEHIGLGALNPSDEEGAVEIEYMLLPAHWGKGHGTGLVKQLLEMAKVEGYSTAVAITDPANLRSKRILDKCGFAMVERYLNEDGEEADKYRRAL